MRISSRTALPAAVFLALAACSSGSDDVDGSAPPADQPGSSSGGSVASPTAVFDPAVDSESERGEDGRRWYYKAESQSALYGPPNSDGMLTLRCDAAEEGTKLIKFVWISPGAIAGETRTLEVRSGGETVRTEVAGVEAELGPGATWQGEFDPEAEEAQFLLETDDPISLRLDDGSDFAIRVPPAEQMRQVIRGCR